MTVGTNISSPHASFTERVELVPGLFTQRRFLADWTTWHHVKVVSLEQAVFLSFGVEPKAGGYQNGHCGPARYLFERDALAILNLGPGGAINAVGDAKRFSPMILQTMRMGIRLELVSFADWIVANQMPLGPGCPRTPPPSLARQQGAREQQTRARVVGLLALALAKRLIPSAGPGGSPKVSSIRDAVLHTLQRHPDVKGLGRATLDKYIKEGMDALDDDWHP
jgi:hypothetical protein